tara:strand:- start:1613 stop:1753 length:141 start_codon:yes stop_codon:yes gene_type:complete
MVRAMFIAIEVAGLLFIVAGVYAYSEALAYIVFGAGLLIGSYFYNR